MTSGEEEEEEEERERRKRRERGEKPIRGQYRLAIPLLYFDGVFQKVLNLGVADLKYR